jgi:hypothetical protein
MKIHSDIRSAVIADLTAAAIDKGIQVNAFFNGFPSTIVVPETGDDTNRELPAIAVALSEGEFISDDFEEESWQSLMTIRIYSTSDVNNVDVELDVIGQVVIEAMGPHYRAGGLITTCTKSSFQYGRDDIQPWGTLDINFSIEYTEEV